MIAGAAALCATVLVVAVVVVSTSTHDSSENNAAPAPVSSSASPEATPPSPSTSVSLPPQPPVNPLAEINQDQLVGCIRATGELPGAHSSPDLTKLQPAQVVQLVANADESVRQLRYTKKVPFDFITHTQMDKRVVHMSLSNYSKTHADRDAEILSFLGAVPPGTDLRAITKQALGGQVAGFYDDRSRKLVVGTAGAAKLGPSEVTTLAHELDHALVDQALGFPPLHDSSELLSDESLARHALLEGDAVLDQTFFEFSYLSVGQQLETSKDPAAKRADRQLGTVPHYLSKGFLFPYTEGVNFTCHLYLNGGWPAIDEAYFKPPTSTAQIMWPDRYAKHEAPIVPRAPHAPPGWHAVTVSSLGAAELEALFEAPGNDTRRALNDPRGRARAWAGGRVYLYGSGTQTALSIDLVQHRNGLDLCNSIRTWYERAFPDAMVTDRSANELTLEGPQDSAFISCGGREVREGIAPTVTTARDLTR